MSEQLLARASKAYYDGNPFLSDEEYDALEQIYGQIIAGGGDVPHAYRMYSLKKHYDKDGEPPLNIKECIKTPKLDGAAVAIVYVDGDLSHMLTRGDGIKGRDITDKAQHLGIPECINQNGVVQITGEVVASKDIPNSRNYASGALNLKELDEYYSRVSEGSMKFIAYNVQYRKDTWGMSPSYKEDLNLINSWGFHVINAKSDFDKGWELDYPTDGTVYRLQSNQKFNSAGFTDKFPRGAYAYKTEQEAVHTVLLDVVWQTGKSGKVTPVAILEPVEIGGATITRATLNNIAYIEALDLEIGCGVRIIRSGEIIPKIVGKVCDSLY